MKMYREQVLKEPAAPSLVQIGGALKGNGAATNGHKSPDREAVGASGD